MVQYKYDAWGNHVVLNASGNAIPESTTHIGHLNPFRYRSYFYDTETGFYYLKSRYYDPKVGRFLTPDDVAFLDPNSINGTNLFSYCNNDPVNCVDPTGQFAITTFLIAVGIGMVAGAGIGTLSARQNKTNLWQGALTGALLGGFIGAVGSLALGGAAAKVIGTAFLKGGTIAVAEKLTEESIAYLFSGKEMSSVVSYMGTFAFGGSFGLAPLSKVGKIAVSAAVIPIYDILVEDMAFRNEAWSNQKFITNMSVAIYGLFVGKWSPILAGVLGGFAYELQEWR